MIPNRNTDPTAVIPATVKICSLETWTLNVDISPQLGAGQSISSVTSAMIRVSDESSVTLTDTPAIVGNAVQQTVVGPSDLSGGDLFRLRLTVNIAPYSDVRIETVFIQVSP